MNDELEGQPWNHLLTDSMVQDIIWKDVTQLIKQ